MRRRVTPGVAKPQARAAKRSGASGNTVTPMPAYLIVETDVTDPEQYEQYKAASPGAIAAFGGRFIARGGALAVLEGDWNPKRVVLVEFPEGEYLKGQLLERV